MAYMGGKHRQSRVISPIVDKLIRVTNATTYEEPFCGAMSVAMNLKERVHMKLADKNPHLIGLYGHLQRGGTPAHSGAVCKEEYRAVMRAKNPDDWRTAAYGMYLSFGGKYMSMTYAPEHSVKRTAEQYTDSMFRKLAEIERFLKTEVLKGKQVVCEEYNPSRIADRTVVYLDPPYHKKGNPSKLLDSGFDHDWFWQSARELSERCVVLVTEMTVPEDLTILHDFGKTTAQIRSKGNNHTTHFESKPNEVLGYFDVGLTGRAIREAGLCS
jgi:site-specific DNA-adenine methylase